MLREGPTYGISETESICGTVIEPLFATTYWFTFSGGVCDFANSVYIAGVCDFCN